MNINDLLSIPKEDALELLDSLTPEEIIALNYTWEFWAREGQKAPPGSWTYWLLLAGRGYGKTRVGAEWTRGVAESGKVKRIHLVAPTNADIRSVMLEGESGLLEISPNHFRPKFEPSKWRVVWPNGVKAYLYSAEEPERLRGPQCGAFWADELGAWAKMQETWDQLQMGFRIGKHPQGVITTTPRPVQTVRDLLDMEKDGTCVITRGSTYENRQNLAAPFFKTVISAYEGTRLGKQELQGIMLEDNPNALFTTKLIDKARVAEAPKDLLTIVTSVDPNVTASIKSDESGIITVGKKLIDDVAHYYVMCDDSVKGSNSTDEWGRTAVKVYYREKANRVIAEANNGGDLVIKNITAVDNGVPVSKVIATRGKTKRAEPVSTLYEQGRVHHCGTFEELENQMCEWDPTIPDDQQKSPDRMDALVWAITYLMEEKKQGMSQGSATRG